MLIRKKKTTSQDVADVAGVSRTTVSLVLNGRGHSIPQSTQDRVLAAAQELGFVPSAAARQLRSGGGKIVLVLAAGWMPSGKADEMWSDISTSLGDHGFTCVISRSAGTTTELRQLLTEFTPCVVVSFIDLKKTDIALLHSMHIPLIVESLDNAHMEIPDTYFQGNTVPNEFALFQKKIGLLQAEYMIRKQCRSIAYLGVVDQRGLCVLQYRVQGVESALAQSGLKLQARQDVELNHQAIETAMRYFVDSHVDAICAFNDDYAIAAIAQLQGMGIRVPQEMRIIGVDNISMDEYVAPSLTTVDFDVALPTLVNRIMEVYEHSTSGTDGRGASIRKVSQETDLEKTNLEDVSVQTPYTEQGVLALLDNHMRIIERHSA